MNRWNIPAALEAEVLARDQRCIYCGSPFSEVNRRHRASWEHIVNDERIVTRENIALCCIGCNASKGAKPLALWLETTYCKVRGIDADTVAPVARAALIEGTRGPQDSLMFSYSVAAKSRDQ